MTGLSYTPNNFSFNTNNPLICIICIISPQRNNKNNLMNIIQFLKLGWKLYDIHYSSGYWLAHSSWLILVELSTHLGQYFDDVSAHEHMILLITVVNSILCVKVSWLIGRLVIGKVQTSSGRQRHRAQAREPMKFISFRQQWRLFVSILNLAQFLLGFHMGQVI